MSGFSCAWGGFLFGVIPFGFGPSSGGYDEAGFKDALFGKSRWGGAYFPVVQINGVMSDHPRVDEAYGRKWISLDDYKGPSPDFRGLHVTKDFQYKGLRIIPGLAGILLG